MARLAFERRGAVSSVVSFADVQGGPPQAGQGMWDLSMSLFGSP